MSYPPMKYTVRKMTPRTTPSPAVSRPAPEDLHPGMRVSIEDGPFCGTVGIVEWWDSEKITVRLVSEVMDCHLEVPLVYVCRVKPDTTSHRYAKVISDLQERGAFSLALGRGIPGVHDLWVSREWIWWRGTAKHGFLDEGSRSFLTLQCARLPILFLSRDLLDDVNGDPRLSYEVDEWSALRKRNDRVKRQWERFPTEYFLRLRRWHPHPIVRASRSPARDSQLQDFRCGRVVPLSSLAKPCYEMGFSKDETGMRSLYHWFPLLDVYAWRMNAVSMYDFGFLHERFQVQPKSRGEEREEGGQDSIPL